MRRFMCHTWCAALHDSTLSVTVTPGVDDTTTVPRKTEEKHWHQTLAISEAMANERTQVPHVIVYWRVADSVISFSVSGRAVQAGMARTEGERMGSLITHLQALKPVFLSSRYAQVLPMVYSMFIINCVRGWMRVRVCVCVCVWCVCVLVCVPACLCGYVRVSVRAH